MTKEAYTYLSLDALTQSKLVEAGTTSQDELIEAQQNYTAFVREIELEWTPERITHWKLEKERRSYKFYTKRKAEIEIENRDARARGVSYAERQKYSKQLAALDRLIVQTTEEGKRLAHDIKTGFYNANAGLLMSPMDVEFIHSRGFETHLKYATM